MQVIEACLTWLLGQWKQFLCKVGWTKWTVSGNLLSQVSMMQHFLEVVLLQGGDLFHRPVKTQVKLIRPLNSVSVFQCQDSGKPVSSMRKVYYVHIQHGKSLVNPYRWTRSVSSQSEYISWRRNQTLFNMEMDLLWTHLLSIYSLSFHSFTRAIQFTIKLWCMLNTVLLQYLA